MVLYHIYLDKKLMIIDEGLNQNKNGKDSQHDASI